MSLSVVLNLNASSMPVISSLIDWFFYDDEFVLWSDHLKAAEDKGRDYTPSHKPCLDQWRHGLVKAGNGNWSDERKDKRVFKPTTQRIIADLFKKYVKEEAVILEVGANRLDDEGESTLSEMIPAEYKTKYVYSDCYKRVAQTQKLKTKRKYLHLNAAKLSRQLRDSQEGSQDAIVSLNVLVVINRSNFFKIAQEAYESLNPGGIFMILSDNAPQPSSVMDCEPGLIAIPWKASTSFGEIKPKVTIGSRERFMAAVKNPQIATPEKYRKFLEHFFSLNPLQQQLFIADAWDASLDKLLWLFRDILLLDDNSTTSDFNESYASDAEAALINAGFNILLNTTRRRQQLTNNEYDLKSNYIENKITTIKEENRAGIPYDRIIVVSNIKVILAQKNEPLLHRS